MTWLTVELNEGKACDQGASASRFTALWIPRCGIILAGCFSAPASPFPARPRSLSWLTIGPASQPSSQLAFIWCHLGGNDSKVKSSPWTECQSRSPPNSSNLPGSRLPSAPGADAFFPWLFFFFLFLAAAVAAAATARWVYVFNY